MRQWTNGVIVSILLVGALALPATAFVPRTGRTVVVSEALQDDLYLAGGKVTATAPVDGDVVAAGGTVDLSGDVSGGVLVAGGMLTVGGAIGRTLRAAGGMISIDSRIKNDAVLAGGTVRVGAAAQVGRDLVVGGGSISVSGGVGRNATISGGDVVIGGAIQGDAEIHANRITVLPTARIGGALRYSADEPVEIQPGAQIAGGTTRMPAVARPRQVVTSPFSPRRWLWRSLAEMIALLVLGFVVFAAAPKGASTVVGEVRARFGRSLLTGFVLLVTVPAAAVLLAFTVIGIPLSVFGMLLYLATLYPGLIFATAWVGDQLLRRMPARADTTPSIFWVLVVGAIALVLLFAVPFAGWLIRLVTVLVGFGALWTTVWRGVTGPPSTVGARPM